jgi:transcription antitermination protein NusB
MSSNNGKNRHLSREIAIQFLFRQDGGDVQNPQGELEKHFEHFAVPAHSREYAATLALGTLANLEKIDEVLQAHVANWKIARMPGIDRSILRMSTYELLRFQDLQPNIIIDEAIELGRQFGTADSPSFINGILDAICRNKEMVSSCGASLASVKMK